MKECEECGKTLGMFEGYKHPTMGKSHNLCSPCFDNVNESVAKWQKFVIANSFNNGANKQYLTAKMKTMAPSFNKRRSIVKDVSAETNILMRHK
jgi:hypothetical protein